MKNVPAFRHMHRLGLSGELSVSKKPACARDAFSRAGVLVGRASTGTGTGTKQEQQEQQEKRNLKKKTGTLGRAFRTARSPKKHQKRP